MVFEIADPLPKHLRIDSNHQAPKAIFLGHANESQGYRLVTVDVQLQKAQACLVSFRNYIVGDVHSVRDVVESVDNVMLNPFSKATFAASFYPSQWASFCIAEGANPKGR